jgi:single-strand DNA-binding protein
MNTIVGRVTKNAEINLLANDRQVVNFSVAINDSYKTKQGERREQVTYYNCSYWINTKIAPYLTKGTLVELDGRTSASAWMNKDGELRSGLNFSASRIKLHGGGNKEISKQQPTSETLKDNPFADEENDDLPF